MNTVLVKDETFMEDSSHASIFCENIQKQLKTFCKKLLKHGFNARNVLGNLPEFTYVVRMPITRKAIGFIVTVNSKSSLRVIHLSTDDMKFCYTDDNFLNDIMERLVYDEQLADIDDELDSRCGIDYTYEISDIKDVDILIEKFKKKIQYTVLAVKELLIDEYDQFIDMCKKTKVEPINPNVDFTNEVEEE